SPFQFPFHPTSPECHSCSSLPLTSPTLQTSSSILHPSIDPLTPEVSPSSPDIPHLTPYNFPDHSYSSQNYPSSYQSSFEVPSAHQVSSAYFVYPSNQYFPCSSRNSSCP